MFDELKPITSLAEVKAFASYLFFDLSTAFHPDDDLAEYVHVSKDAPAFSKIQAERLNQRMEECRKVCDAEGADIYDLMNMATPYFKALASGMDEKQAKKAVYFASDSV